MISTVDEFRGQQRALKLLDAYLTRGRLAGCVLLLGQRGLGKTTLATIIARALTCEANREQPRLKFCGKCYACRTIAAGEQSEYLLIRPKGTDIKVEQMDEDSGALYSFSLHPVNLSHRILVIDEAHCLNETTSNQMLKLLEEPPERSVFFLVTDKPQYLLPTIHSRGLKIVLTPEAPQALQQYLHQDMPGLSVSELAEAAAMAGGRYADARLLALSGEWRQAVRRLAAALASAREIASTASELIDYEYAALWGKELADTGLSEAEAAKVMEKTRINELKRQSLVCAYDRAAAWYIRERQPRPSFGAALSLLKRRINQNVDPQLSQAAFELLLQG